ncbi:MAG TPA: CinY protein [Asanoa sp.]
MSRRLGPGLLASLVLASSIVLVPSSATAFGTIEGGGQHREHERITRAAVACPAGTGTVGACFEPRSIDQLAGHGKTFGAVGSPDLTEVSNPAAHCDDADFLVGGYPQTRDRATTSLLDCVNHLRGRFREAVDSAKDLLDEEGHIVGAEVSLDTDCDLDAHTEQRAKCEALEGFGRALHGAQDFYSHSNWADVADPSRAIGADNPPGLNLPAPTSVLDLRGSTAPTVPPDLTTGCFVLRDSVPGVGACEGRVTHAALNKDTGLIDPNTGATTGPTTPRGKVGSNFANAVAGAIVETRRQWQDFQVALEASYGAKKASLIACALTRDDPLNDCRDRNRASSALVVSVVLIGLLGVGILSFQVHRRRRVAGAARPSRP